MKTPRPHDLIWIDNVAALAIAPTTWLNACWHPGLPLVVRRDCDPGGRVPVGVRGDRRDRRAAGWVNAIAIVRCVRPEALVAKLHDAGPETVQPAVIQAARLLACHSWPWSWGITGSVGYGLATNLSVLHNASDLDLIIRAPEPLSRRDIALWLAVVNPLPCRIDIQIETPVGAFAAHEWLRGEREVLVKTNVGPQLMADPWQQGTAP